MKQAIKRELKPKLRFPEFRDDWVVKKLGELGKLSGGGTPDKSVAEYWQGDIPWVSSSDIYEDDIYTISVTRFINEKSISESATKIVPKGSVLFVSRVGTGKLAVNDIDVCTSQDFMNFIPKKVFNYFLGYFFIANKSALVSLGQGTSIKGFSKGDLEKLEVSYPCDLEQQKIADCLSSIDELITLEDQKLDTLKVHKKGLMQQLFPAEGETLPKLRFPEFRDAGEWDADELGEVAEFVNEKIPLERIALENYVSTENILPDYGGVARASKLPAMGSVTRFKPNDTLVSNIRPYLKKVWVADKEGGASNDVIVIRAKQRLLPQYFSFLLKNDAFIDYVMTGAKGVKMPRGDIGSMKEYPALYPSKIEQQKIADCLSSIDELITAEAQKLDTLKAHKKGLMQQLFPALDEVSA